MSGAPESETFLRMPDVRRRVGLSKSEIYRRINRGDFPKPISLGSRTSVWTSSDLDAWIAGCVAQSKAVQR